MIQNPGQEELFPVVSSGIRLALQCASSRFSACPNGVPRDETDLGCLLVLVAHGNIAASVQGEKLFPGLKMTFTEDRKKALLAWCLQTCSSLEGGSAFDVPPDVLGEVRSRIHTLWNQVCSERIHRSAQTDSLRVTLERSLSSSLSLDSHQAEAVLWWQEHGHKGLIADEMGLGKTIEALGMVLSIGPTAFPVCIVCPASMIYTWKREVEKWLFHLHPTVVLMDTGFEADSIRNLSSLVVIGSYDRLVRHTKELVSLHPRFLVGDESHYLKEWESQRTRAFLRLRSQSPYRVLLSGTPIPNGRYREMYSQLKILDPSVFSYLSKKGKDRYPFLRRYCDPKTIFIGKRRVRSYDGRSNEAEFGRLLQSYQIRRTKDEVGLSLPPFTRYAIEVPLTSRDRLSLAQIEDRIRAQVQARARELEREWLDKGIPQERIDEKIRQILGSEALRLTSPLQQELGKKKAQWSVVRVRELLQEGHKVLVFAYHIDVAKEAGRCYAPLSPGRVQVATGEVIGKARDRLVQEAEKGSYDIFVVTSAFREGLTLNSFDRGMSLQRFWVPAWESQAESRIHRWGQDKSVSWDYLVCSGTLDDHIGELVTWKERGQAQAHGSPEERVIRWLLQK